MKIEREYWNTDRAAIFAGMCLLTIATGFVTYAASQIGFFAHDMRMAKDTLKGSETIVQSTCSHAGEKTGSYLAVACTPKTTGTDPKSL